MARYYAAGLLESVAYIHCMAIVNSVLGPNYVTKLRYYRNYLLRFGNSATTKYIGVLIIRIIVALHKLLRNNGPS